VFPEGTISRGKEMRALSGAGRLALAAPHSRVVAVSITGAVDIYRFPKRPRITVNFFEPSGGQPHEGESAIALTKRVMGEVRAKAPFVKAGR
jgi:1-acyl-sn-glycerol-3-phosphate acyltransferase